MSAIVPRLLGRAARAAPAATAAPAITFAAVRREVAMIAAAAVAYIGIRAVTEGRTSVAEQNAYDLLSLERALGLAWEERIQSLIIDRDALVALANWVYIYGHWPVIATVAVLLFVWRRDRYRLLRTAVFVSGAIGFLFFAFVPLAVLDVAVGSAVVLVGLAVAASFQPAAPLGAGGSLRSGAGHVPERALLRHRWPRPAAQEAMVLVKGGYTPDSIVVERGKPVRLTFRREESSPCSEQVVFEAFGKHATLPEGEQVAVELMPTEPGVYAFTCQKSMLRGTLVVA